MLALRDLTLFLGKPQYEIVPMQLDQNMIRTLGSTASRMNGYIAEDVGKIALNMKSKVKAQLNLDVFGEIGSSNPYTKGEIEWLKPLKKMCVAAGFNLLHNHQVGDYKVDFVIPELRLGLECNGYNNHANYDQEAERIRENFVVGKEFSLVRFHHQSGWEELVNGMLLAEVGTVIKRYEVGDAFTKPPTNELQAVYYGELELIDGIVCDAYVFDDNSTGLSERGAADLFGITHHGLQGMATNGLPKILEPFMDKGWSMTPKRVKVVANNSPYKGREITVYDSKTIEGFIRCYALAFAHNALRINQEHIGKRCTMLACALSKTTITTAIEQVCNLTPEVKKTIQLNCKDVVESILAMEFKCSAGDIATKKDIQKLTGVPMSTLNYHLDKLHDVIEPIRLDRATIRKITPRASRMNGYRLADVGKIVLEMDSVIGIELKRQIYGIDSSLASLDVLQGRNWQLSFARVFAGLTLLPDYVIAGQKVAFFVPELNLVLELLNGQSEARLQFLNEHYRVIYFRHQTDWESVAGKILRAKFEAVLDGNVIPVRTGGSRSLAV